MKKKLITVLFLCILCITMASCSHEQTEDIVILYTNDVASNMVEGEVGYDGVKAYKNQMEAEYSYVSLVDAGDFFDGKISSESRGESIVKLMNTVGYDVVCLGNQEFSIGLDNLARDIDESSFDYVSCNIKYVGSGKNPLKKVKPYVIKKYGPTKIAFIGVITPETNTPGKPAYEAIIQNDELIYYFYDGDDGPEFYEQVQATVDKVKKKVDYVIVLAHLGSNSVREGFSSYDLIENTSGIDVVIDGHSHTVISGEGVYNKDGEMVVLTSTGERLQNLGVLNIHPDHTFTTVLYPQIYEKDPAITQLIDEVMGR